MINRLYDYIKIPSVSGDEKALRDRIIEDIKDYCNYKVDRLGNIIAEKKGENKAKIKLQLDAHMDEIGFIITYITDDGYLKFAPVGGIDTRVAFGRRVRIGETVGVIGAKPVHLLDSGETDKVIGFDDLYIDIGAKTKAEAQTKISLGDTAVFDYDYRIMGDSICGRGIDDKAGCVILVEMIRSNLPYDMTFTFTCGEEVGCRGANAAAFGVQAESAIVVESTTASDIHGVSGANRVCVQGNGAVVSFMDNGAVYDRGYFKSALECKSKTQVKSAVAGGNNSSAIHKSHSGVRTLALSVPCRYIHSQCSVAKISDIQSVYETALEMAIKIASGELD